MFFSRLASWASRALGRPQTFVAAVVLILCWAACGPWMHYSENWQIIVNTGTTIASFLMLFLIQNSQNRGDAATHLKLDEIIRVIKEARNEVIGAENKTDAEIDALRHAEPDLCP